MLFIKISVVLAAALGANAKVFLTNSNFDGIATGIPFEVTWANATGLVGLLLKNGPSDNQLLVDTIASGLSGGSYEWIPAEDLPAGVYNLEIQDTNGDINYSPQFGIADGVGLPIVSTPMPVPTVSEEPTVTSVPSMAPSLYVPDSILFEWFATPYPCPGAESLSCTGLYGVAGYTASTIYPDTSSEVAAPSVTEVADPTSTDGVSSSISYSMSTSTGTAITTYINPSTMEGMYSNSTMTSSMVPSQPSITQPPASSIVTALAVPNATPLLALFGVGGLAFLL